MAVETTSDSCVHAVHEVYVDLQRTGSPRRGDMLTSFACCSHVRSVPRSHVVALHICTLPSAAEAAVQCAPERYTLYSDTAIRHAHEDRHLKCIKWDCHTVVEIT